MIIKKLFPIIFRLVIIVICIELGLQIVSVLLKRSIIEKTKFIDKNSFKILCVGDSHTMGAGAPAGKSYPDQLKILLQKDQPGLKFEIMNFGVAGINSVQIKNLLEKKVILYQPDLVILNGGINNFWNISGINPYYYDSTKKTSYFKLIFHRLSESLYNIKTYRFFRILYSNIKYAAAFNKLTAATNNNNYQNQWQKPVETIVFVSSGAQIIIDGAIADAIRFKRKSLEPIDWDNPVPKEFKSSIKNSYNEIITFLNACGIPMVLETYLTNNNGAHIFTNEAIVETASKYHIPVVRNDLFFSENLHCNSSNFLNSDGHPNEEGYSIMAENTLNVLAELIKTKTER